MIQSTDLNQPAILSSKTLHFPAVEIETGLPSDTVPEYIKQISHAILKSETLKQSALADSILELAYGDFRIASWYSLANENDW